MKRHSRRTQLENELILFGPQTPEQKRRWLWEERAVGDMPAWSR